MKSLVAAVGAIGILLLAGCASSGDAPEPSGAASSEPVASPTESESAEPAVALTATEVATELQGQISTITQIVTIDETNDPNGLIGRPNGYVDGAVLYDSSVEACPDLGVDCGATLEVWPDAAAAEARSAYILELQSSSPILGSEYHYLSGSALLRVSGDILPSVATEWEAAFTSAATR